MIHLNIDGIYFENPRRLAVFHDWPAGSKRVTCEFAVQTDDSGRERVLKWTTSRPTATAWFDSARIVDGSDGRTYVIGLGSRWASIQSGSLKEQRLAKRGSELYEAIANLCKLRFKELELSR